MTKKWSDSYDKKWLILRDNYQSLSDEINVK